MKLKELYPALAAPGQWVHVRGSDFPPTASVALDGVGLEDGTHFYGPTELGFRVPADEPEGKHPVVVSSPQGFVGPLELVVGTPKTVPKISSVSVSKPAGVERIYVHGEGFVFGKTGVRTFGADLEPHVHSPHELAFDVPANASKGSATFEVVTPYGRAEGVFSVE